MQVKICGIREPAHAVVAAAAGADFIGMVFAPSRRQVTVQQARDIIAVVGNPSPGRPGPNPLCPPSLKGRGNRGSRSFPLPFREEGEGVRFEGDTVSGSLRPAIVGVFVNASAEQINRIAEACGLEYVQLSGDEPPELLDDLCRPAIKAVRLRATADLDRLEAYATRGARLLVDSYHAGAYGGTGRTGDWGLAAEAASRYEILLAGGLTPASVGEAVARVQPWGVDVSSGVERDGVKDPGLIEEFVQTVRRTSPTGKGRGGEV